MFVIPASSITGLEYSPPESWFSCQLEWVISTCRGGGVVFENQHLHEKSSDKGNEQFLSA